MKSCCDEYCSNHGCNQGRDCPVRIKRIAEAKRLLDRDQAKIPALLIGRLVLAAIALLVVVVSLYVDAARVVA